MPENISDIGSSLWILLIASAIIGAIDLIFNFGNLFSSGSDIESVTTNSSTSDSCNLFTFAESTA